MTGSSGPVWEPDKVNNPTAPERERPAVGDGPMRPVAGRNQRPPKPNRWREFVRRYGWRAYALPLLVVITVLALFTTNTQGVRSAITGGNDSSTGKGRNSNDGPPTAASNGQLKVDTPGAGALNTALPALKLPPGQAYTERGSGSFSTIPGTSGVIGKGKLFKFSIEVENGITGVDLKAFADVVMTTLRNPQSWIASGTQALQRVDSGPVDFHLSLVTPMTVRNLCGYDQPVETSCYAPNQAQVVLNLARWVRGAKLYSSDLATYREYAVNHEVGHALGHSHSHECLAGGLAPVMMQQTIGAKTANGKICQANPWPYPKGVADAPGPEEPGADADNQFFARNSS
jgi:hypothetical protein